MSFTIVDSMVEHARSKPDEVAFRFLSDIEHAAQELSYKQLLQEASVVAMFLSKIAEPGSRVMLFFPPGLAYIKAFYGCLLAGMVAVPLYPPRRNVKSDRIMKVAQSCQSVLALTTQSELASVKAAWEQQNSLNLPLDFHATDNIIASEAPHFAPPVLDIDAPAFLQYTSGSTGVPKGVIITHRNIIANMQHLSLMSEGDASEVFVNWVPLFHDLGLVTAILWPLYLGAPSILMAPATFVRSPLQWLKAISHYRGTMCGAPNFAFDLCVEKTPASELSALDLSSWRVAYNSAEPIKATTLDEFSHYFSPCGFKAEAFYPCYGMAEATVFIAGGESATKPTILTVDKNKIADFRLELLDGNDPMAIRIVGCGTAFAPHEVKVVDPDCATQVLDGTVGEIWFSGPSVSPGYWKLEEISRETFGQRIVGDASGKPWLRTGDLGVMWHGELFVTGRMKDLIILHGRNYYPQDIEESCAAAHESIRAGCCAAFSLIEDGAERLVVVAEVEREYFRTLDVDAVTNAIRQRIWLDHEANVDQVVLLKPYKIPVTSSGKIQRRQTRQMLLANELELISQSGSNRVKKLVEPSSEIETILHDIWRSVLKCEKLGVTDNFFSLGGDSLAAIDVSAQVQKHFKDVALDIEQLLDFPTIAQLASFIELHANSKTVVSSNPPLRQNHAPSYECAPSLAQQRMLFMEELAGNNSYYNIPVAYEIAGPLDKPALAAAFARLVAAHDVLRSVYVLKGQAYVQRICEPAALAIREIDLLDETDKDGALQAILAQEADYRFNLQDEWPIKVSLIALAGNHHVLSINIHHIAADGWSARRIVDEIGAGYKACLSGADSASELAYQRGYQYADYVAWQDAWQQSDRYRDAKAYWLKTLDGAPQRHSLPTDFMRPSVQVIAGATWSHQVTSSLFTAIGAAARAFQTTPFVILQCGFAALLARYSGESDIVFGTAVANRQPVEFVDTVGLFVNTLVLRYSVGDNLSFADLIEQGKEVSADAFRHQQLPFDVLVDVLQPKRSLGYNPLVQIMLVMQESDSTSLELAGARVVQLAQYQQVSKFDLALHVHAGKDGFQFKWEFNTSLYTLDTIKAMSEHVEQLLSACLAAPERVIDSVPMIAASPAAAELAVQAHPQAECIHRLFEARAALQPGAIAIIDGVRTLTYQELDLRANELARHLYRHLNRDLSPACDGESVRIGVCMEKSIDLIVAMLAIYKIGAVYVPLDPHYPKERIEFMIRDSGMKLLLVAEGSALPADTASPVPTLDVTTLTDAAAQVQLAFATDVNAPAYIIYTSGSTGQPKGVLVTQSNLFHSLRANQAVMGITGDDIMPTIGSQAFGVSLLEILLPLVSGGAVRIVNKAQVLDVEKLVEVTDQVTVLHAVPSLMRQWLDAVLASGSQAQYPHLRLLLVGGEAVPAGLLKRIRQWRPSVRLLALYGMTESTIVCSSFEPKVETSAHYCIGKPYASSRFYVLNRHGQQQPMGVPGELHIGGLSIAAGYINQPQLTDERFIRSPLFAGERLYKTGDRVRLLADGNHEFMGRVDHQVSLRGARIELGEIEALVGAVHGVRQAVAHVVDLGADEQTLVLYYTSSADGEPPVMLIERIRSHLAQHLPDYMRPSLIQPINAFPLNPNGKVDRKKLPRPEVSDASEAIVAPATEIEQRLVEIWKSVLQCDSVSVTANFFEIGGHSLLAAKLIAKVRSDFGISFPLAQLFESPTIRACALCVENALMDKYAQKLLNNEADRDSTQLEEMTI